MNNNISNLEPKVLWKHFYSLTQIPRPSKKEGRIIEFAKNFGEKLGLKTIVDEVGNVIIKKPATPGMENRKGIILQGHLDMVPQKNSDKKHDFEKDPIEPIVEAEWVRANGTTLGADNGIGVASVMAILAADKIAHGPLEGLFTATEETGMDGANGLEAGVLQGDILIKLDDQSKAYSLTKGVKWVQVSPEEEANTTAKMKPVLDTYVQKMKAKNLPGDETLKFCQEYIKTHP